MKTNFNFLAKQKVTDKYKTGGGPPPPSPTPAEQIYLMNHSADPAVQGIEVEDGIICETLGIFF